MNILKDVFGALLCLAPMLAVAAWLVWASRRPHCPKCHYAVSKKDETCRHCGSPLKLTDE